MVLSGINSQIEYREWRAVEPEDVGHAAAIYELEAFGRPTVITLGKPKYSFSAKHVVFYPIYAVRKDARVEAQIGVFELAQEAALKALDEDGDPDIDQLGAPLFYAFAEELLAAHPAPPEDYLHAWTKPAAAPAAGGAPRKSTGEVAEEAEAEEPDAFAVGAPPEGAPGERARIDAILARGVFEEAGGPPGLSALPEETEAAAKAAAREYRPAPAHCWLQRYMKSEHYALHDVEPGADSLFAAVRDAFAQLGARTTVAKLRALAAAEMDDADLQRRRREHADLAGAAKRGAADLARIKGAGSPDLKRRAGGARARGSAEELARIVAEGKALKARYKELGAEVKALEAQLRLSGGAAMAGVESLDALRALAQTAAFAPDAQVAARLERKLGAKFVVLSEDAFADGDLTCVLDPGASDGGAPLAPARYIVLSRKGAQYRLASYRGRRTLAFSELPHNIRALVVNKCLERNAGGFWDIQDFRNLKTQLGLSADAGRPEDPPEGALDAARGLYDPDAALMFHAKACKTPAPGLGVGERRLARHALPLAALGAKEREGWRRALDDAWTGAPFALGGERFASVEHFAQAAKFRAGFPDFARQFSLDSGSAASADAALARALGGDAPPKRGAKRPAHITEDPAFCPEVAAAARAEALRAKFSQNQDAKNILLLTRDAELTRYRVNRPAERDAPLMLVRQELGRTT